jgi:hypothetical protein
MTRRSCALAFLIAYAANFVQIGWLFTAQPDPAQPGKLNPQKGASASSARGTRSKPLVNILKLIGDRWG